MVGYFIGAAVGVAYLVFVRGEDPRPFTLVFVGAAVVFEAFRSYIRYRRTLKAWRDSERRLEFRRAVAEWRRVEEGMGAILANAPKHEMESPPPTELFPGRSQS